MNDPLYDCLFNQGCEAKFDKKTKDQVLKLALEAQKILSPDKKIK